MCSPHGDDRSVDTRRLRFVFCGVERAGSDAPRVSHRVASPGEFSLYNYYGGASGWISAQLFNITADPLEERDLKFAAPAVVARLNVTLQRLVSVMAPGLGCQAQTGPGADSAVKVWRAHNDTIGPYIDDPLYMYECSVDYCTLNPTAAPSVSSPPTQPVPTGAPTAYAPTARPSPRPSPSPTVPAPTARDASHPVPAPTTRDASHPVPAPTAHESLTDSYRARLGNSQYGI